MAGGSLSIFLAALAYRDITVFMNTTTVHMVLRTTFSFDGVPCVAILNSRDAIEIYAVNGDGIEMFCGYTGTNCDDLEQAAICAIVDARRAA